MTTYSAIANSEIAVGAPITNSLMTKVRDNPLAIQENDATAPTVALATNITSQGALATLNTVSGSEIVDATAGDYLEEYITISGADIDALVGTSYIKVLEMNIVRDGTYRIRSSILGTSTGADNAYSTVYKNGGAVGTEQSSVSTRATRNDDLALVAGDLIQLYMKTQLASQEPDGPAYLMVCSGNPIITKATYTAKELP